MAIPRLLSHRCQLATRASGGPPEFSWLSFLGCIHAGVDTFDIDLTALSSDQSTTSLDAIGRTQSKGHIIRHDLYSAGGWTSSTGDIAYASIPDNTLTLAQHTALDIGSPNGSAYAGWHPLTFANALAVGVKYGLKFQIQPHVGQSSIAAQIVRESGIPLDQISILGFGEAYADEFRDSFGDSVRIITHIYPTTSASAIASLAAMRAYGTSIVSLTNTLSAAAQVETTAAAHAIGMQVRCYDGTSTASDLATIAAGRPDFIAVDALAAARTVLNAADGLGTGDTDLDGATDMREYLTGVSVGDSVHLPREIWEESETQPNDGRRMWRGRLTPSTASETNMRSVGPWVQWSLDGSTWEDMPRSRVNLRFPIPSDPVYQIDADLSGNYYHVRLSARRWAISYP